jgi:hypothetical protein
LTTEQKESAVFMKQEIYTQQGGRCAVCGMPLIVPWDLAHRISKSMINLKLWGPSVIHHRLNLRGTCRGYCNDAVAVNPATQPVKAAELVELIRLALIEEER